MNRSKAEKILQGYYNVYTGNRAKIRCVRIVNREVYYEEFWPEDGWIYGCKCNVSDLKSNLDKMSLDIHGKST